MAPSIINNDAVQGETFLPGQIFVFGGFALRANSLQKKDTSVTFWAEQFFFCHTYDTSVTIIVRKPGIIIDVVGSYFYEKKS